MIYIEAPEYKKSLPNFPKIFLAGGITNCPDWQSRLVKYLKNENIIIFNPRRKKFPIDNPNAAFEQIKWEFDHFRKSDIIIFWFSRGSLNPIVLFEYGKWFKTQEKEIILGIDPEYPRKFDVIIQTQLELGECRFVETIEDIAEKIKEVVRKK